MTRPLTAEQITACRAILDKLNPTPRDRSENIHARALARAREARRKTQPATTGEHA